MRWMWIDQIIELAPDRRLVSIKNVSLAEEHMHDHFAGNGQLPARIAVDAGGIDIKVPPDV